jgi:hypothetical protein|tara:strand:- start:1483 stop:2337 length:855 start_codon:yes stop_codon:yes gene_type:complete
MAIVDKLAEYRKDINLDFIKKTHVHYCTPCYAGQISEPYFRSWTKGHMMFTKYNIPYTLTTSANESLISRARCHMVAYFMANPEATHMMFIDADINFDAIDILHMLQHDKDIIIGAYPKKELDWASIKDASDKGLDVGELKDCAANYAMNPDWDYNEETDTRKLHIEDGLVRLKDAATGFMLIKRSVIEKMVEAYPEMHFNNDLHFEEEFAKWTYLFFDCMHEPTTKRYLSEDYAFCRRWQALGGEVWLDPLVKLDHVGHYTFNGNISKMFYTSSPKIEDLKSL